MIELDVPVAMLKDLYTAVSSSAFDLTDITMTIADSRINIKQRSPSGSTMVMYQSVELPSLKDKNLNIAITLADLKNVSELSKDKDITFEVGEGSILAKVGKIKKTFPSPVDTTVPDKTPNFKISNSFELNPDQVEDISKALADCKGDIRISVMDEIVTFSSSDETRKSEIEFDFKELQNLKSDENARTGYDHSFFLPVISLKLKGGINKVTMEFGDGMPIKIITDNKYGLLTALIAPIIYDD